MNIKFPKVFLVIIICLTSLISTSSIVNAKGINNLKAIITTEKRDYKENEDIKYNLVVINNSDIKAENIVITNILPKELQVIKTDSKVEDNVLTWQINNIKKHEQIKLSFICKVKNAKATIISNNNINKMKTSITKKDGNNTDNIKNITNTSKRNNGLYRVIILSVIGLIIFIYLFKVCKSKKIKRGISILLVFIFSVCSFKCIKAESTKEHIREIHKLKINNKEYVSELTVNAEFYVNTNTYVKHDRVSNISQLQWNKVEGATYEVRKGESKNKLDVVAKDITDNTFLDVNVKEDKKYFYDVTVKKNGKNLYTSDLVQINEFIDSDKDGLTDEEEKIYKTDPNKWDTDGDKLSDGQEIRLYHTNPLVNDTDGDRLSDWEEIFLSGTNPNNKDTDGNGVTDDLEDADNDTINNYKEINLGSNPKLADSDFDGLTDDKELLYKTNLLNEDTDNDGILDGDEVKYGINPLNSDSNFNGIKDGEEEFKCKVGVVSADKDKNVEPFIEMSLKGKDLGTVSICNMDKANSYLNEDIPGYIGAPFQFLAENKFDNATISFVINKDLFNKEIQLTLYSFNEKTKLLEELPNQKVDILKGTITANVKQFSTYIVLNKKEVDKVWDKNIKSINNKIENSKQTNLIKGVQADNKKLKKDSKEIKDFITDTDKDGIPDYYEKNGLRTNTGEIVYTDPTNPDTDGDGLKDGEEVKFCNENGGYFIMNSNPSLYDSDEDGSSDKYDVNPMKYELSDRQFALFSKFAYTNVKQFIGKRVCEIKNSKDDFNETELLGWGNIEEIGNWKLIDAKDDNSYGKASLGASTYKLGNNIIIAYRGSESTLELVSDIAILGNTHHQAGDAYSYAKKAFTENKNCKMYLTGHSLGGFLALKTIESSVKSSLFYSLFRKRNLLNTIERVVRFNAPNNGIIGITDIPDLIVIKNKIISYRTKEDKVSLLPQPFCLGKKYEYLTREELYKTKYNKNAFMDRSVYAPHDMANFLYYLEPKPKMNN